MDTSQTTPAPPTRASARVQGGVGRVGWRVGQAEGDGGGARWQYYPVDGQYGHLGRGWVLVDMAEGGQQE